MQTPADLRGQTLAVEMGSQAHQEARRLRDQQRIPLSIELAQSCSGALDLLQAGKVDAVIVDLIAARQAVRARPGLAIRGDPLTDESFVIAVPRDNPGLFAAVNGVLNDLRGEGWLAALADRWL